MKMMTKSLFTLAVVSGAMGVSGEAQAYERKHSAFFCNQRIDDRGEIEIETPYSLDRASGVSNRSSGVNWRRRGLYCPVLVDSNIPLNAIHSLDVNGFDGDSGADGVVYAQACVSYRWANGALCGNSMGNGAASVMGLYGLQFRNTTPGDPLYVWRNYHVDYPYVYVSLPGAASYYSNLSGYTIWAY
jgi:hypothetical protein